MTLPSISLLRNVLRNPEVIASLTLAEWDLLIRQGRAADLLGRIAAACDAGSGFANIPVQPRLHIESASNLAKRQLRELEWEVEQIRAALNLSDFSLVLLKGAAYALSGMAAAKGRLMSDVDILVRREDLAGVESALMRRGWVSAANSDYNQRYYRTWMHEIPPMTHFQRGTVIDVHHAILPLTARFRPSPQKLLAAAQPLARDARIKVLAPVDMLLHSATHLFHEGDLAQGLRGLVDIDSLLVEFGSQEQFWAALVPRAVELELSRPLFYALRYASIMLGTAVPVSVSRALADAPGGRQSGFMLLLMDSLFLRALRPPHASAADRFTPVARWLLYMRGHWLRMPPWLLIRHLAHKLVVPVQK